MAKYFKNVRNLEELKKVYRELARNNHPDLGGNEETMKEINNEFDIMFKLLPKTTANANETATEFRHRFYTQNGWAGRNYDRCLSVTDVAKIVRQYVKEAYPECKFSVTTEKFSGGSAINVYLVKGAYRLCKTFDELTDKELYDGQYSYYYRYGWETDDNEKNGFMARCYTDDIRRILKDVEDFVNSYRYDDSDGMIDYFDTNFYKHIDVCDWGKHKYVCDPDMIKKRRVVPVTA